MIKIVAWNGDDKKYFCDFEQTWKINFKQQKIKFA
jgi:hypothetical protein